MLKRFLLLLPTFIFPHFTLAVEQIHILNPSNARSRYLSPTDSSRLPYIAIGQGSNFYYASLLWFDLEALPKTVTSVKLELYCVKVGSTNPTIPLKGYRMVSNWDQDISSGTPLWARYAGTLQAPQPGNWYRINITSIYQRWCAGNYLNSGLGFAPVEDSFGWSIFCGSDHAELSHWPRLIIDSDQSPEYKLIFPLTGPNRRDQISGYRFGDRWENRFCLDPDKLAVPLLHDGVDYHASSNEAVYAIASGKICLIVTDQAYGGLVAVSHDESWTSTYVHLLPNPSLVIDQAVNPETFLGNINTGNSGYGPHLHLQIRAAPFDRGRCMSGVYPQESCHVRSGGELMPAWPEHCIGASSLSWRDR